MRTRRPDSGDRGFAVVLFALSLTFILVIAALVVGLGNARQADRDIQNDIDASLLAAAQELDGDIATDDSAVAEARACEYLIDNGYDVPDCSALPFQYVVDPDGGAPVAGVECLALAIDGTADIYFGGAVGDEVAELDAAAVGCRNQGSAASGPTEGPDVPAGFAGGTNCDGSDPGFDTSGNRNYFEGDIHANDNPKDGGSNNGTSDSQPTYVGNRVEIGNLWRNPPAAQIGTRPWPDGFSAHELPVSLYQPGGDRAVAYDGFYNSSHGESFGANTPAGVYYRNGNIFFEANFSVTPRTANIRLDPTGLPSPTGTQVERTLDGITVISGGALVEMKGDNKDIQHFELELNRLVIYANWNGGESSSSKWCTKPVMNFGGKNCIHFDGIVYAPRGAVEFNGNGNGNDHNNRSGCGLRHPDFSGGIIAYGIKFNGERHYVRGGPGSLEPGAGGGDGRIFLGS